jgi:hypothetical protein
MFWESDGLITWLYLVEEEEAIYLKEPKKREKFINA